MMEEQKEEQTLMEQYLRLQVMMQRYFMNRRRENGPFGNPHRGQGRVLKLLQLKPETTQKELSYLLDMRPQSLGELLGKLEKKGYITREPLESDRRVMVIKLTEAGTVAADASQKEEDPIFNHLTDDEKKSFSKILEKMTISLEAALPEEESSYKGYPDRGHRYRGRSHKFSGSYDRMNEAFDSRKKHCTEWKNQKDSSRCQSFRQRHNADFFSEYR